MSLSLRIKRTFISFAQQYFRDVPTGYQWNKDPRLTAIFIGDKYSAKVGTAEKYPAIILTAGSKRWAKTSIDQRKQYPGFPLNRDYKVRADLVQGSIVYQCISDNGVEAGAIADALFNAIVAYKDALRRNGIHQILDVQIGEEQLVRADNVGRLYAVPVMVAYAAQSTLTTGSVDYSVQLYTDAGNMFIQSLFGLSNPAEAYTYTVSGTYVVFASPPPSGISLKAVYVDGVTLDPVSETLGTANGVNTTWALSSVPYSTVYKLQHIKFSQIAIDPL